MQERFCNCGAKILVEFTNINSKWQPVFWKRHLRNGIRLHICPSCGQLLNIHEMS